MAVTASHWRCGMLGELVRRFGYLLLSLALVAVIGFAITQFLDFRYQNEVIVNPVPMPTECNVVMSVFGQAGSPCPPDRNALWTMFANSSIQDGLEGRQWKSEMYNALFGKECQGQVKRKDAGCVFDEVAFQKILGEYQSALQRQADQQLAAQQQAAAELAAEQAQETDQTTQTVMQIVMSLLSISLIGTVGSMFAFTFYKEMGNKISALTVYFLVFIFTKDKEWISFGIITNDLIRCLTWVSFGFLIASPLFSIAGFALSMLSKYISSAGEGFYSLITTPLSALVSSLGSFLGSAPANAILIAVVLAVQGGVTDPITIVKASAFGSAILIPGITCLLGDVYTLAALIVPAMKLEGMMSK